MEGPILCERLSSGFNIAGPIFRESAKNDIGEARESWT